MPVSTPNGLSIHTLNGMGTVTTEAGSIASDTGWNSTLSSPTPLDLRNGVVQFSIQRANNSSAATQFAVYVAVNGGPMASTPIFDLLIPLWQGDSTIEPFVGTIPNTAAYQAVTSIKFYIFPYSEYWSYPTGLTNFQFSSPN